MSKGLRYKLRGADEVIEALRALDKKLANQILRTELRAAAKEIAAHIKPPQGATGRLARSVKVRAKKKKKRGTVAFTAQIGQGFFKGKTFYGAFVEFGTAKQSGQHFMEHGFQQIAPRLEEELPQRILARIEAEMRGAGK